MKMEGGGGGIYVLVIDFVVVWNDSVFVVGYYIFGYFIKIIFNLDC